MFFRRRKPWDLNPQRANPAPVFKTGSSSGRLTSVVALDAGSLIRAVARTKRQCRSCGSWTRTSITAFRAPRPAIERSRIGFLFEPSSKLRVQESNPRRRGSKPRRSTNRHPAMKRVPCGSRTRLARLEAWNLCRSAKGTCCFTKRKPWDSNPQRTICPHLLSRQAPHPAG